MRKANGLVSLLLAVCLLAGCTAGGGKAPGNEKDPAMGRYLEKQLAVLEGDDRIAGSYVDSKGDFIFYFNRSGEESGVWRGVLQKGGAVPQIAKDQPLTDLVAGGTLTGISARDGDIWALYRDGDYNATLAHSTDGVGYEAVEVPGWANPFGAVSLPEPDGTENEEGADDDTVAAPGNVISFGGGEETGLYPYGVIALEDGFLITYGMDGVYQYDKSGGMLRSFDGMAYGNLVGYWDGQLALADLDSGKITLHNLATGEQTAGGTYDGLDYNAFIGLDATGLYVADSTGVHRSTAQGWEKLVDGGLTSLMFPNISVGGMATVDDTFLAILEGDESLLVRYAFDPDIPAEPDTRLELFALRENATVRQAIGEFQRKNPNVRIDMEIGMTDESAATLEDVIRSLNTRLIAGKGPDLLMLDGLPVDSLIDKGVLTDLKPLLDKIGGAEDLLGNIMTAWARENGIYGVASRFGLPVMLGDLDLMKSIGSLSDLADRLADWAGETPLLTRPDSLWEEGGILMDYYDACAHLLTREDGSIDESALAGYYTDVLRLNAALREVYPQMDEMMSYAIAIGSSAGFETMDMGSWTLGEGQAKLHPTLLAGMMSLNMISDNLKSRPEMGLDSLFGGLAYRPVGGIGIVAATKHPQLAEAFVETLLSRTVQDKYLYDGFPVNARSLAAMLAEHMKDREEKLLPDLGLEALSHRLARPIFIDLVVKEAVQAQTAGLLDGSLTPELAAANVVEKTRLYLAE